MSGLARRDDPSTAKAAARALKRKKKYEQYGLIIECLAGGPLTHEEIGLYPGIDTSAHRTRCNELVKRYGAVEFVDKLGRSLVKPSLHVARWGLTDAGRELA